MCVMRADGYNARSAFRIGPSAISPPNVANFKGISAALGSITILRHKLGVAEIASTPFRAANNAMSEKLQSRSGSTSTPPPRTAWKKTCKPAKRLASDNCAQRRVPGVVRRTVRVRVASVCSINFGLPVVPDVGMIHLAASRASTKVPDSCSAQLSPGVDQKPDLSVYA